MAPPRRNRREHEKTTKRRPVACIRARDVHKRSTPEADAVTLVTFFGLPPGPRRGCKNRLFMVLCKLHSTQCGKRRIMLQ